MSVWVETVLVNAAFPSGSPLSMDLPRSRDGSELRRVQGDVDGGDSSGGVEMGTEGDSLIVCSSLDGLVLSLLTYGSALRHVVGDNTHLVFACRSREDFEPRYTVRQGDG